MWGSCHGWIWWFQVSVTCFVYLILYIVKNSLNDENLNMQSFIQYIILSNWIRNQLIKINNTNTSLYSQMNEHCKINLHKLWKPTDHYMINQNESRLVGNDTSNFTTLNFVSFATELNSLVSRNGATLRSSQKNYKDR